MSILLLSLVTLAYAGIAINEAVEGSYPMSLVFAGYTLANLGLMAKF